MYLYTLELPSNPIGRPGPFLSISSRGPCSRLGRHSWPVRGPSRDSTPHGSPTTAPAAGLFARTAWKTIFYFCFYFIFLGSSSACTQKEIWSDWATNLEEEFFHAAFACFLLVHTKVSRPLQLRIGTVQRDGAEGQRQGQYLRPARLQQPHLVVEGHFQKPCHVKGKNKKKGGEIFPLQKEVMSQKRNWFRKAASILWTHVIFPRQLPNPVKHCGWGKIQYFTWNLFSPTNGGHQFPIVEFAQCTKDPQRWIHTRGIAFRPQNVDRRQHFGFTLSQRVQDFIICKTTKQIKIKYKVGWYWIPKFDGRHWSYGESRVCIPSSETFLTGWGLTLLESVDPAWAPALLLAEAGVVVYGVTRRYFCLPPRTRSSLTPSFSMPIRMHFWKRQAWQAFRRRLLISQSLEAGHVYSMFPAMEII